MVRYRLLKRLDIPSVAAIHSQELEGFLSTLGTNFLQRFYLRSLDIPEMFTVVAIEKDIVVGFATGVTRADGLLKKIIGRDIFWFFFFFLRYFCMHPQHIVIAMKTLLYPGLQSESAELLSLAVNKEHRGRGMGSALFMEIAKICQKQKCHSFAISAYVRLPANAFYQKLGCTLNKTFLFLGEEMNYYSYVI